MFKIVLQNFCNWHRLRLYVYFIALFSLSIRNYTKFIASDFKEQQMEFFVATFAKKLQANKQPVVATGSRIKDV